MATVTYGAAGTLKVSGTGNLTSVAVPAGIQAGYLMVAVLVTADNVVATFPAGWTKQVELNAGSFCRLTVATKVAGAGEAAFTITRAAGGSGTARVHTLIGAAGVVEVSGSTATSASLTVSAPDMTTLTPNDMILFAGAAVNHSSPADTSSNYVVGTPTGSNPGWTKRSADTDGSGSDIDWAQGLLFTGTKTDASAVGARTLTMTSSAYTAANTLNVGAMLAVTPAASPAFAPLTPLLPTLAQFRMPGLPLIAFPTASWSAPSGTAWTQNFGDTITLADAVAKGVVLNKADSITASDAFTRVATFFRSMADTITLSDAVANALVISKADSITLSDALSKVIGQHPADSITLSDAFSRTASFVRPFADTVTLTDAAAKAVGLPKSDTITLSDAVAKSMGLVAADSVALSDAIAKTIGLGKSDSITLTDAVAKAMAHALADSITLTDSMTPSLGGGSGTAWTLNLADTITLADALHRTLTDAGASAATAAHARVLFINRFGIY